MSAIEAKHASIRTKVSYRTRAAAVGYHPVTVTRRLVWSIVALAALSCCGKSPQSPQQAPPTGEPITGNERLGWTQQAADATALADFRYAIYVDGARAVLAAASCAPAATSGAFDCTAPLPRMNAGSHALQLAAFTDDGGVLESTPSAAIQVIVSPAIVARTPPASSETITDGMIVTTSDGARLRVDAIAAGLEAPTDLAAAPDGRLFIAEMNGRVQVVHPNEVHRKADTTYGDDRVRLKADTTYDDVESLLALAVDPRFDATHFVFAIETSRNPDGDLAFRLARYRETRDTLADRAILVEGIRASSTRPAASLRFGPDGRLYAAFDDGGEAGTAADLASFSGKILRLNADGTTPEDQAAATPVFSSEYHSPRGLDWQASSATLWIADQTAGGATRLSAIARSAARPFRAAVAASYVMPALAGASAVAFYRGDLMPALRGDLFIASDEGRHILRIHFDPRDPSRVATTDRLLQDAVGGIRAVAVGPDGAIYFCTHDELARIGPVSR